MYNYMKMSRMKSIPVEIRTNKLHAITSGKHDAANASSTGLWCFARCPIQLPSVFQKDGLQFMVCSTQENIYSYMLTLANT